MPAPSLSKEKLFFIATNDSRGNKTPKNLKLVQQHNFIYSISITIPGVENMPSSVLACPQAWQYFSVPALKLSILVQPVFIEAFIKRGALSMLSVNRRLDVDSTFCILPSGMLVLNLLKNTYECLGLEGRPSKLPHKHVVEVSLRTLTSKRQQRLISCLTTLSESFDAVFHWSPPDESTDSRSLQAYLLAEGCTCKEAPVMRSEGCQHHVAVPSLNPAHTSLNPAHTSLNPAHTSPDQFLEWLGAITCQCSFGEDGCYENSLEAPQPSNIFGHLSTLNLSGFFPPSSALQIISHLRSYLDEALPGIPWISVSLHGFQDAPVRCSHEEHTHNLSGDLHHTLVLFRGTLWSLLSKPVP